MNFDITTVSIGANAVGRRVFSTSVAEEVGGEGGLTRAYVMGLFPALTHSIWNDLDMKCKNPQGHEELHKAHWSFSEFVLCEHGAVCFLWPYDRVLVMHRWANASTESAASNKLSTRQPPAPIFVSDLDNRTRPKPDCHIQGLYGHEKPGKVMEF